MKRSEINKLMREGSAYLAQMNFLLPQFAYWSPATWQQKGPECREIIAYQTGWDVTDFGSGDFANCGLFLFTLRNGLQSEAGGKVYAEKIMIVQEGQLTPTHFHSYKMEDIINRGGGELLIQLWNATVDDQLADTEVSVSMDGVRVSVPAGGIITLKPGDSVTLTQRLYHNFKGKAGLGTVLVGEVSRVNDDYTDNHFYEPIGRFPAIEEDEAPLYLLGTDYAKYYRGV